MRMFQHLSMQSIFCSILETAYRKLLINSILISHSWTMLDSNSLTNSVMAPECVESIHHSMPCWAASNLYMLAIRKLVITEAYFISSSTLLSPELDIMYSIFGQYTNVICSIWIILQVLQCFHYFREYKIHSWLFDSFRFTRKKLRWNQIKLQI